MHRLLKSLYIRHVSADYRFAIFRDVTYKLQNKLFYFWTYNIEWQF
jgi:hypothetical protein